MNYCEVVFSVQLIEIQVEQIEKSVNKTSFEQLQYLHFGIYLNILIKKFYSTHFYFFAFLKTSNTFGI